MIQWWVGSMAIQFISFCELDDEDDVHDQLLADAAAEAMTVLNPHPQPYEPPVDTLAAPDLLNWVGSSFRERGTRAKYFVEDAGMSIARGEYFMLRAEDGQERQVLLADFKEMVDGVVPSEDDE
ncbi:hypothetical protein FA95DRAFT_1277395 [Auriscalpium vulgare]|uniref:Uncharacterized protein n=1 Tax=Auriscalpium vulgare TaxID=40419 RepID=A0ACB8R2B6_9AGAM|nr:hypothetical protein FA95DRAFT_1277395 [Auriscalpium vulgare]